MNPAAVLQKWGFVLTGHNTGSGFVPKHWTRVRPGSVEQVPLADAFDFATDLLRRN